MKLKRRITTQTAKTLELLEDWQVGELFALFDASNAVIERQVVKDLEGYPMDIAWVIYDTEEVITR